MSPRGPLDLDPDEFIKRLEIWMTQALDVSTGAALTCSLNAATLEAALASAVAANTAPTWNVEVADINFEGDFQPGFAIGTGLAIIETDGGAVSTRSWTKTVKLVPPAD